MVAGDLSRFLRARSYSRTRNRNAWPTQEEFARLHELTLGVPLATVESPLLSEDERHSGATKRTGRAGRPRAVGDELAEKIFAEVSTIFQSYGSDRRRWFPSLRQLSRMFHVSPATIHRLLYQPSPFSLTGQTWLGLFEEQAQEEATAAALRRLSRHRPGAVAVLQNVPRKLRLLQNPSSARSPCFAERIARPTRVLQANADFHEGGGARPMTERPPVRCAGSSLKDTPSPP